jgi:hypothetical protein
MNNRVYKFNIFLLSLLTIETITSQYLANLVEKNNTGFYSGLYGKGDFYNFYNSVFILDYFRIILVGLFIFTFFADLINQILSRKVKIIHTCIALFLIVYWIYSLYNFSLYSNEVINRILNEK